LKEIKKYVGIHNDARGGMTDTGKIIRDAWVFGLIPESETCEGWLAQGVEDLWVKVNKEWEKYGFLVRNLPPELQEKFMRIQTEAVARAKAAGWDPDLDVADET
jgi:hypothetical protein